MKLRFIGLLLVLLGCLLMPQPALANGTWSCEEFMGPNCGEAINDVFMVAHNEAWAVGDYGTILHKVNGEWLRVDSPTTGNLNRLKMIAKQGKAMGWAVGDDLTIIYFDGSTWSLHPFIGGSPNADIGTDLFDLDLVDAENGWTVGVYGYKSQLLPTESR